MSYVGDDVESHYLSNDVIQFWMAATPLKPASLAVGKHQHDSGMRTVMNLNRVLV